MASRILSVIGRKDTGKTTLVVALASELTRRGRRVMTIKHASHPVDMDRPGSDSWRHLHEGKAERVLLASPDLRVVIDRTPDDTDPITLARRYLADADLVLVEGFTAAPLPKIEVFRRAVASEPIYAPGAPNADQWVAIVTDEPKLEAACTVLRFSDTMWLQLVASLAWDRALPLP